MMDEKKKNELVKKIVEASYPDFYKIEADEGTTISDLEDYQRFCVHSKLKDRASWLHYKEIRNKALRKGVGSILFNKEVEEVWKSEIPMERGGVDAIFVRMRNMPVFAVAINGLIFDYQ